MSSVMTSIVIVAYGKKMLLDRLLRSIEKFTPEKHEVIVIDNASPDDTSEWVSSQFQEVRLIKSPVNLGYGRGANLGVQYSRGKQVVIMNSDIIVTENWLSPLLDALRNTSVVIASPVYLDTELTLTEAGNELTTDGHVHVHTMESETVRRVDHISAACWAINKDWFDRIGGFDPAYGLGYYEDVDLATLAAAQSRSVVAVPQSRVVHESGGSFNNDMVAELSHRNHKRLSTRWAWLLRDHPRISNFRAETTRCHGRVVILGNDVESEFVASLCALNLSVVIVTNIDELKNRFSRDDVVVSKSFPSNVEQLKLLAPRAIHCNPAGIWDALLDAGISAKSTPPRLRFKLLNSVRDNKW